ncbi:TIGR03862 family flavoprotein [Xanthomonas prunicola]|uniref:Aminoacetone oxidase family FAD-binding enzyme n=1 Tax=Xanthomonas prunicola TaxID=2053930 RepID=A0A2N3RDZ4_9XANT|nr:TIGR03862 family flavoprotein [Xanthomonas prunicola]PKV10714.1 aminoacetone oxidase family FAD-binding enzyme [Xanthomonas prunicola]PKV14941.1 aminoacetone oxidase family FAD-binding enzyme [Xanthomonas prunicola]PKV19128.1 aminoacetone oxidase family FAD-binding enzyme [Xanthomonas prunicola]
MTDLSRRRLAVIGGGPAGLMAAEAACAAGLAVDLYEAKGSVGRKFLIAGKGGLNLTHSDPMPLFAQRYRERQQPVAAWLQDFDAEALRDWARGLGVDTYVGSSGRVFPMDRRAAPLLRGWVRRLKEQGVVFHVQHRWLGWNENGALRFDTPTGAVERNADAVVLALGGGSWPQLGSDGQWQAALQQHGIAVAPLVPANCGFDIAWSAHFVQRHAGAPLKPVVAHWQDRHGVQHTLQGECVATADGIEGSLIYAMAADLREQVEAQGIAELVLDLIPGRSLDRVRTELDQPRKGRSFSEHLRRQAGIDGVKAALLYEHLGKQAGDDVALVARTLKQLPLRLLRTRPLAEAISSAGGVRLEALDDQLMALAQPGVFCAGEMLDWEAPTGGYLLTACFASGLRAARGAIQWLDQHDRRATGDR